MDGGVRWSCANCEMFARAFALSLARACSFKLGPPTPTMMWPFPFKIASFQASVQLKLHKLATCLLMIYIFMYVCNVMLYVGTHTHTHLTVRPFEHGCSRRAAGTIGNWIPRHVIRSRSVGDRRLDLTTFGPCCRPMRATHLPSRQSRQSSIY